MGGRSSTRGGDTTSSQTTDTTNVGLQDTSGIAIAGGEDVNVQIETTDLGAIQGAFDLVDDAFAFANDAQGQAAGLAERSIETSQSAVATVATGGQSDLSKIDSKTMTAAIAALVAIFVLPQILKRK